MTDFKEFQGKTLDDAIGEACTYYGVEREKLEIDIINDAKSGIFGLVGAKKATVKARRIRSVDAVMDSWEQSCPTDDVETAPAKETKKTAAKQSKKAAAPKEAAVADTFSSPAAECPEAESTDSAKIAGSIAAKPSRNKKSPAGSKKKDAVPASPEVPAGSEFDEETERETHFLVVDESNSEAVFSAVRSVVQQLVAPIVGDVPCEVALHNERIRATLDCGEEAGILVGREGQTLASVQSLASRILAKQLGGGVRLQIDVGNYRERQDERLKELALHLSEKAKRTRRSQATRPLSAYQRRIIHLTLEGDEQIQTHSKGEGAQRRVIVQLKRQGGNRKPRVAEDHEMAADVLPTSQE